MTYLKYDNTSHLFFSTGKRPNNQNTFPNLKKISARLNRLAQNNKEICLTSLQQLFIKKVAEGKPFLQAYNIDIAHHIAISKIIELIITILNKPKTIKAEDWANFCDAVCSTESSEDDKGRAELNNFLGELLANSLTNTKNNSPHFIGKKANGFIKMLNACTRNLIPGDKSLNRSIGAYKDLHLVKVKGKPIQYKQTPTSTNISLFFAKCPIGENYLPKRIEVNNKKVALSSSLKREEQDGIKSRILY